MAGEGEHGAGAGTDAETRAETDADREVDAAASTEPEYDDWYRWGRVVLYAEMALATLVTVFSLYLAFSGQAGFLA